MKQIEKNTVSSKNQLNESDYISYINPKGKGKRIMFVGNSITRHGIAPQIGWNNDFGMAASSMENDYVHILNEELKEIYTDAAICICQASVWESDFVNGNNYYTQFETAREFNADIIIMRIVENCDWTNPDHDIFYKEYGDFIDFLNSNNAKILLTSSFWKHPLDLDIEKFARNRNYPFLYLGDLGEDDSMKAVGLFEHSGVAGHPGDKGMREIADRIFNALINLSVRK